MLEKIKDYYKNNGLIKTIKWIILKSSNKVKLKINVYKTINNKEGNIEEKIKERKNKRIFIFASVPYFDIGGGQRSSQLANTFNKKNYDIFYIYGIPTNESVIHKLEFPTVMHKYIKKFKQTEFNNLIAEDDIVIFEMPTNYFLPFLNIAYQKKAKIVYESIDNWETSLGQSFFNKETLNEFLKKADLLTATAKPLVKQLENYLKEINIKKKVLYSANAVNSDLFNPNNIYEKPTDIFKGEKTFLYYGSLWGTWFDWQLIKDLALSNKNYEINLIGDEKNIKEIIDTMPTNIHFLGLKKQSELPKYLCYTDYSILPFKNDSIGKYVSPLKIFEYISMNTRVLTTALPDIENYPNTFCGDNYKDWLKIIELNPKINIKEKEEFIQKNNWSYRCDEIIKELMEVNNEKNN